MYTLTRFLYPLDEVELSFIQCLLNKANLQECYFWIFEIHFSGFDVFPFLWKVYLDFYKELNPLNLEDYIIKKNEEFLGAKDDLDIIIKSIASIVRNLFKAVPSPNTFFLRQYFAIYNDVENHKNMNNKDEDDNTNYKAQLLNAIGAGDFEKVCYSLYRLDSLRINSLRIDSLDDDIISLLSPSSVKKSIIVYSNPVHYLLALCIMKKNS